MKFYNEIEKPINLFEEMGVRRYLKFYVIALKGRYRHRGKNKWITFLIVPRLHRKSGVWGGEKFIRKEAVLAA